MLTDDGDGGDEFGFVVELNKWLMSMYGLIVYVVLNKELMFWCDLDYQYTRARLI